MHSRLDEHRQYLSDAVRLQAYQDALRQTVQPGMVVLDLAAGTGILGMLACRAGAARVYAIEVTGLVELGRELARANGFADRITFVQEHSSCARLPERVDLLVCDQVGHFGFEAGYPSMIADACERFLKPNGLVMPSQVDLFIAPVECPELYGERVSFWGRRPADLNFSAALSKATNTVFPAELQRRTLIGEAAHIGTLGCQSMFQRNLNLKGASAISRNGTMHGLGGWFEARLSEDVAMTNSPLAERPIARWNLFLPLESPANTSAGDRVAVELDLLPAESMLACRVRLEDGKTGNLKGSWKHSTFAGQLISKEALAQTLPGYMPSLSSMGEVRRSVLELCDGRRTREEIEVEILRRHPDVLRSAREAAGIVSAFLINNSK